MTRQEAALLRSAIGIVATVALVWFLVSGAFLGAIAAATGWLTTTFGWPVAVAVLLGIGALLGGKRRRW